MRLKPFVQSMVIILMILPVLMPCQSVQAATVPAATTYYTIAGELAYDGAFTSSYSVSGVVGVRLTPLTGDQVRLEAWGYQIEGEKAPQSLTENTILHNRQRGDGNYTLFFIDLPAGSPLNLTMLNRNVAAQYWGVKYVNTGGESVQAYYYCHVINELQSILRFEWYFEAETGILLKFSKSIEINFIRVQWLEYGIQNTTIELQGTHPITAFFVNIQEHFFAGTGAVIGVILCFYLLSQKKFQRRNSL